MAHILIIIRNKIKALKAGVDGAIWQDSLEVLELRATELDRILIADESKHGEEIHEVLEALQGWLETASVSATDFEAELNHYFDEMEPYL